MNLLITGAWQQAKEHIAEIEQQGHTVAFLQYEKDPLPCDETWVEGVVCNGLFLHHPIEKFVNLKYIQLTSAGFDRVPMEYVSKHQITICNARDVYSIPMAEFALSGVLQLYKKAEFFWKNQKAHVWEKHRDLLELAGKQVCIVGCGSVGTKCAKRFKAFDCIVTGIGTYARSKSYYDTVKGAEELENVLSTADIVVLTVPLNEKTKYLMNDRTFGFMKEGAVLVNIARGAVVCEKALVKALQEKLGGAVLDVFEEEPLDENSPLWDMEQVILTPHNSFVGEGNGERLAEVIKKNLKITL